MTRVMFIALALITGASAHAKTTCTKEGQDKWMKEADFRKKVEELGYKVEKFKKKSSCYEVEGLDKDGKKVEVYFNPVDASVVKVENED